MSDEPRKEPRLVIFSPQMVQAALKAARERGLIGDLEEARIVERVVLEKFDRTPQSEEEAKELLIERLTFEEGVLVERYSRD